MTLDSALLYRPTDSLILPDHRRFFPFKIPNSHHQLRHYISTADSDRIYVAVGRIIYIIHISVHKREIVAVLPFDPKCLTAGLGWIAVGGSENGDCAFIKLPEYDSTLLQTLTDTVEAEVDSPLPLDSDPAFRRLPPRAPELVVQQFGGTIVNSVTLHHLTPPTDLLSPEDLAILSNNDKTVSIFSLTRREMLATIRHPVCMNYAILSPNSKLLAAVGDTNEIWFYRVVAIPEEPGPLSDGDKFFCSWSWPLIKKVDLEPDTNYDDPCCFTIAFSPCSKLCAVGSQGGTITIFDVSSIFKTDLQGYENGEEVLCVFRSSRTFYDGGAVRSMTFSPRPWDLLVWVEDHGRVGVADIRQAFSRRQIINLDMDETGLERIPTENLNKDDDGEGSGAESENDPSRDIARTSGIRDPDFMLRVTSNPDAEDLSRDLTARERQIIEFLNTARWRSTIEDHQASLHDASPPPRGSRHSPLSTSPPPGGSPYPREPSRAVHRVRYTEPRRRGSVLLSPDGPANQPLNGSNGSNGSNSSTSAIPHPTITLRWTASPSQLPPTESPFDSMTVTGSGRVTAIHATNNTQSSNGQNRPSVSSVTGISSPGTRILINTPTVQGSFIPIGTRHRLRSRSIPRRSERPPDDGVEPEASEQESRPGQPSDRTRSQRRAAIENQRLGQWEQHYRRLMEFDRLRTNPRFRSLRNDLSDRANREEMGVGTAGVGWGTDGRKLYVGTEEGIFEYKINVQDRKTFPGISCR